MSSLMILFLIFFASTIWGFKLLKDFLQSRASENSQGDIFKYLAGRYLERKKTQVRWGWKEPAVVGSTFSFNLQFFFCNSSLYPISEDDDVTVIVMVDGRQLDVAKDFIITIEGTKELCVTFTVRISGIYQISILYNNFHIPESPFQKRFLPGKLCAKTSRVIRNNFVELIETQNRVIATIEARDEFENHCDVINDFQLKLFEADGGDCNVCHLWDVFDDVGAKQVTMTSFACGCFKIQISHENQLLRDGNFFVIVLSDEEKLEVDQNVKKRASKHFKCLVTSPSKPVKKISCYVTVRQIIFRDFYFGIIPKFPVAAFRVSPNTKIQINNDEEFEITDHICHLKVVCSEQSILLATFQQMLHLASGGDSIEEKIDFFRNKLCPNISSKRDVIKLKIDRNKILQSSFQATRNFSTSDWRKQFFIEFRNEEGLDYGGVSREWFELICQKLFLDVDQKGCGLFKHLQNDSQSLTLPCSLSYEPGYKLKHFEFCGKIVAKGLLESCYNRQYHVTARFARSFLSQIIGLPVSYAHFETDDPDLYSSKIAFLRNHDDVRNLQLTFSEEVFSKDGKLDKVYDLVPNGSKIAVTNDNRSEYLNLFAKFRLCDSIKDEVEAFRKGLFSLVNEENLLIFNEMELELVMCGSGEISVEQMKTFCVIDGNFELICNWFWSIISSFTKSELAQLLHFTTGCSQLPFGGFKQLNPPFKISFRSYHANQLPTAHTCFNELCLPNYDSCERLHKMLKIAITEGSHGFELV